MKFLSEKTAVGLEVVLEAEQSLGWGFLRIPKKLAKRGKNLDQEEEENSKGKEGVKEI